MADVIIFGVKDTASLAHYYLRHDSPHRVVGFAVHREYMPESREFEGLPVCPFEELEQHYPPERVSAFAPMTYRKMNRLRQGIYAALKSRGYPLISYVSSRSILYPDTPVGDNCFILEGNVIQPFASIGSNVIIWSGCFVAHHAVVHDHAFIASQAVISGHCTIGANSVVGVNATIRDQVAVAEGTLVGMGANVTRNTEPWSLYKAEATRPADTSSTDIDF